MSCKRLKQVVEIVKVINMERTLGKLTNFRTVHFLSQTLDNSLVVEMLQLILASGALEPIFSEIPENTGVVLPYKRCPFIRTTQNVPRAHFESNYFSLRSPLLEKISGESERCSSVLLQVVVVDGLGRKSSHDVWMLHDLGVHR